MQLLHKPGQASNLSLSLCQLWVSKTDDRLLPFVLGLFAYVTSAAALEKYLRLPEVSVDPEDAGGQRALALRFAAISNARPRRLLSPR
jgi:hypothetical protein